MRHWWVVILIISLVSACATGEEQKPLPSSGGSLDEVMIIVDDVDLQTPFDSMLIYAFFEPYPGLPQLYEPLLPIKIREWKRFKNADGLFGKYRHLAFVGILEEKSEISLKVQQAIGEDLFKRAYQDSTLFFAIERNKYSKPQLIIYLFAPTREILTERLLEHKHKLVNTVKEHENKRLLSLLLGGSKAATATKHLEDKMGFTMQLPGDFSIKAKNDSFLWVRAEEAVFDKQENITKQIKRDWLFQSYDLIQGVDVTTLTNSALDKQAVIDYPFILRDNLLARHIMGQDSTYHPYTDIIRPLFQEQQTFGDVNALISRGLWRMDLPFMGGPFINATFYNADSTKLIMIDGLVYAAGSDKRKLIREYEALLTTIDYVP